MPRLLLALVVALAACGGPPARPAAPGAPTKILVLVDARGVALGGYDPVSYTHGPPVPGNDAQTSSHGGATYHFASPDTKQLFERAPAAVVPGFGGYCAFAAAQNRLSAADPTVFTFHAGQLLVFTNEDFKAKFLADPAGNKAKADAHWPGLVAQHGIAGAR